MSRGVSNRPASKQLSAQKLDRQQIATDLKAVLGTPSGLRLMLRILEDCQIFDSVWCPEQGQNSFRQGDQRAGLRIYQMIEDLSPGHLLELHKMRISRKQETENESRDADSDD